MLTQLMRNEIIFTRQRLAQTPTGLEKLIKIRSVVCDLKMGGNSCTVIARAFLLVEGTVLALYPTMSLGLVVEHGFLFFSFGMVWR